MSYAEPLILSVSQLNRYVKARMDEDENLFNVFLTGEISNYTKHFKTGHLYFTLKDAQAAVKAVMFSSNAAKLKFEPQNGLHVLIRGRVTLYEVTGQYQIYVDDMQPEGLGALHLTFEQTKAKLEQMGIFDAAHKKAIPPYPKRIGVITSKVGAALQDILTVLKRRYPPAEVILAPARVQGEGAHTELIDAIARLNRLHSVDVIILGRGGGSAEDLWEFNHEALALAVYHSEVPIISAVGHETDFTICDFAADLRAPTPSAAAELAVPDRSELRELLLGYSYRMQKAVSAFLAGEKRNLHFLSEQPILHNPALYLDTKKMQLSSAVQAFTTAEETFLQAKKAKLSAKAAKLHALSPLAVLGRGYTIAHNENELIRSVTQVQLGDTLQLDFSDGAISCTVEEITDHEKETNL